MTRTEYEQLEGLMHACMGEDSAHDRQHIYRVLYLALDIARFEQGANRDVLIASCLLHDIGRQRQYQDPSVSHAEAGGEMAFSFLCGRGWEESAARHVKSCIETHSYRADHPPVSIEARILFDSDKLDAAGALGIARTLLYQGKVSEPLYRLDQDGRVLDGTDDLQPSFFREYHFKLKKVYARLYTDRARQIARRREDIAKAFYHSLLGEVSAGLEQGREQLENLLE